MKLTSSSFSKNKNKKFNDLKFKPKQNPKPETFFEEEQILKNRNLRTQASFERQA